MPQTNGYKICGNTIGLSLANTSHAAITVDSFDSTANALLVCNTGTAEAMYVTVASSQIGGSTPPAAAASVIPTDGAAGSIPVLAYAEKVLDGLRFPVSVTAICNIAGPTLMTVTPIVML